MSGFAGHEPEQQAYFSQAERGPSEATIVNSCCAYVIGDVHPRVHT